MRRPLLLFGVERPTMRQIAEAVAHSQGYRLEDLIRKDRTRPVFHARALAMYEVRQRTKFSTVRIGQFFGGRDHTTVLNALKKAEAAISAEDSNRRALAQQEAA